MPPALPFSTAPFRKIVHNPQQNYDRFAESDRSTFRPVLRHTATRSATTDCYDQGSRRSRCRHCGEGAAADVAPIMSRLISRIRRPARWRSCSIRTTLQRSRLLLLAATALILYESILRPGTPAGTPRHPRRSATAAVVSLHRPARTRASEASHAPASRRVYPGGFGCDVRAALHLQTSVKYVSNQLR